jgi:hypothetical protein
MERIAQPLSERKIEGGRAKETSRRKEETAKSRTTRRCEAGMTSKIEWRAAERFCR